MKIAFVDQPIYQLIDVFFFLSFTHEIYLLYRLVKLMRLTIGFKQLLDDVYKMKENNRGRSELSDGSNFEEKNHQRNI